MKYASHKFRSTLGKARAVKPNEMVLLAYSGGLSSGTMVRLVCQGQEDLAKKKLVFKPALLYIDEGVILNLSDQQRLAGAQAVIQFATDCKLDVYITSLEFCLVSSSDSVILHKNNYEISKSNHDVQLKNLFDSVKNLTAKEDLLFRLKQRLINFAAQRSSHTKIFIGSTGTRLAGQLLTAMAQGRGAQIADEVGFSDDRSGVECLRPMREFVDKEVAYLAHFLSVTSVSIPTLSTKLGPAASIARLTEDFVVKLQTDYPATISTLFRTGDKFRSIVASPDEEEPDSSCLLCGSRIEEAPVCSAYSARMMSQSVSRSGPHQLAPDTFNLGNATAACNGEKDSCKSKGLAKTCCKSIDGPLSIEDWNPTLCYGCRVTLQDVDRAEYMPEAIQKEIHHRSQRRKMYQAVEQFLL